MTTVTVVRHVPEPVIGVVSTTGNHAVDAFEQALDWLETTGTVVERIDPGDAPEGLAHMPEIRDLLAREGTASLPVIVVNDSIASRGVMLDRSHLAHLVGLSQHALPGAFVRHLAAIAASAAVGDDARVRTESAHARALGIAETDIATAAEVGACAGGDQAPDTAARGFTPRRGR